MFKFVHSFNNLSVLSRVQILELGAATKVLSAISMYSYNMMPSPRQQAQIKDLRCSMKEEAPEDVALWMPLITAAANQPEMTWFTNEKRTPFSKLVQMCAVMHQIRTLEKEVDDILK